MRRDATMPGRVLPTVAGIAGIALIAGMAAALAAGNLSGEGRRIADLAWGRMLLIDVYAGMTLFAAWIAWRERPLAATAWIAALLGIGNLVACVYLARAWLTARGEADVFWHGPRRVARGARAR